MMNQRIESGVKIAAVIAVICFVAGVSLDYYNTVTTVEWLSYNDAFLRAKESNKMVYVDFYADWCQPCKQMDKSTFANDTVIAILKKDFFATRVNVDDPIFGQTTTKQYHVDAMPTSMLLNADRTEVRRKVGYVNAEDFIAWLRQNN